MGFAAEGARAERTDGDVIARSDAAFTLLEHAPLGVYVVDAEMRLRFVNACARSMLAGTGATVGTELQNLAHRSWPKSVAEEVLDRFRHTLATGEPHIAPVFSERRQDLAREQAYEWQIHRVRLPEGGYGVACYWEDVTAKEAAAAAMADAAHRDALRTQQFESLVRNAPVGMYVVDSDFRVAQANPAAQEAFGDVPDLIGRNFEELMQRIWKPEYAAEIARRFRHTLETGEPYATPERNEVRQDRGVSEAYEWHLDRVPVADGRQGVACYFRDVSSVVRARDALARAAAVDAFRVTLADALRPLGDPVAIQREACRVLGQYLDADRVHYVETHDDGESGTIGTEYLRAGGKSLVGRHRYRDFGRNMAETLRAGHPLVISDTGAEPNAPERAALAAVRIQALVAVGLVKGNRLLAHLAIAQEIPRAWNESDVMLVRETADRTWAAVERARAEESARQAGVVRELALALSDALRPLGDPTAIQVMAARVLGERLGVQRAAYVEVARKGERTHYEVRPHYAVPGIPSLVGRLGPDDFSPERLAAFEAGTTIVVDDAQVDDRLSETGRSHCAELGVGAMIAVPLVKRGRQVAFVVVHAGAAHHWTASEVASLEEAAERTWSALERARAEIARRESESRLQLALDAASMGTFVWYLQEDRPEADARMLQLFGLPPGSQLTPTVLSGLIHPEDREGFAEAVAAASDPSGPGTLRHDLRVIRPDGSLHWLVMTARAVFEENPRRPVRLVGVTADITVRKLTEEALREREERLRESDRRKDEFLAMLAHELRNPLAPIRTGLELIRLSGDSPEAVGRVRATMDRQVGHMVRLIDDLLDVSRITSGKIRLQRQPTQLAAMVNTAVEANRAALSEKSIALAVDLPQQAILLDVDPTRFVQVVSNLLHNAVKFTPAAGNIRVAAELRPPRSGNELWLMLTVTDSGAGISEQMLPRVFDLFTQGDAQGSHAGLGIGLALAKRLVEMHGGVITASSAGHGHGSTFTIELPLPAVTVDATSPVAAADAPALTQRIVVIDDNVDSADVTAMFVEALGAETRVAYDGESGLALVLEFQPAFVLLDIGMPGMDGYETCRRIRAALGNAVSVVAMTGWGQERDKEDARAAGFDAHLTKPVDPATLKRLLSEHEATARA
jgi:PAS domain S-box-containing protein